MKDLSIIMPFANEYPQVIFTIRNLIEQFIDTDYSVEIIAVDNFCDELAEQFTEVEVRNKQKTRKLRSLRIPDRGGAVVEGSQKACHPFLKYVKYDKRLSHWQAKNAGIREASGEFLYFVDSHVMSSRNALFQMFRFYKRNWKELKGTIALPLTYKILESRRLIYKLFIEADGTPHYKFTPLREFERVSRVPAMSCCGVLLHRSIMDELGGGWPENLGIYGGGENYFNFALAVMGYSVNIFPFGSLHHHGDPRSYYWNYTDYSKNRAVANYCVGGVEYLERFISKRKGNKDVLDRIAAEILTENIDRRIWIKDRIKIPITDWIHERYLAGDCPYSQKEIDSGEVVP